MKEEIISELLDINAIRFGNFTLKCGVDSPIYIDLRIIVSYPKLLQKIVSYFSQLTQTLHFELIVGIPYTALPIATAFSLHTNIPMVYARKEKKEYGTKQQIEGVWKKGQRVLVLDDLITNGESKFETFIPFEKSGLIIQDILVLINREQGGCKRLKEAGYQLHSCISIYEILDYLETKNKIECHLLEKVRNFLK